VSSRPRLPADSAQADRALHRVELERVQLGELFGRDRVEACHVARHEVALLLLGEGEHLLEVHELELELADERGERVGVGHRGHPVTWCGKRCELGQASAAPRQPTSLHPAALRIGAIALARSEFTAREVTRAPPPDLSGNPLNRPELTLSRGVKSGKPRRA
jgi:hypothetical protein